VGDPTPLPAHLTDGSCGCTGAPYGRHSTSCGPARAHDALPLQERPGYERGRPYRCVSWDYPTEVRVRVSVEVSIDVTAWIELHRKAYAQFNLPRGYEPWEKPMVYLSSKIDEACRALEVGLYPAPSHVATVVAMVDDWDERPRWDADDTARVDERLNPPEVDPDQGDLFPT
jgi:hypothetical protein